MWIPAHDTDALLESIILKYNNSLFRWEEESHDLFRFHLFRMNEEDEPTRRRLRQLKTNIWKSKNKAWKAQHELDMRVINRRELINR